jgi:hypothetical protein
MFIFIYSHSVNPSRLTKKPLDMESVNTIQLANKSVINMHNQVSTYFVGRRYNTCEILQVIIKPMNRHIYNKTGYQGNLSLK